MFFKIINRRYIRTRVVQFVYSNSILADDSDKNMLEFILNESNYYLEPNYAVRSGQLWKEEFLPVVIDEYSNAAQIKNGDVILLNNNNNIKKIFEVEHGCFIVDGNSILNQNTKIL